MSKDCMSPDDLMSSEVYWSLVESSVKNIDKIINKTKSLKSRKKGELK